MNKKLISLKRRFKKMNKNDRKLIISLTSLFLFNILLLPFAWISISSLLWLFILIGNEIKRMKNERMIKYVWYYKGRFRQELLDFNKLDCILTHRNEEFVGVAESPSKTFPRVNEFETGASYRR